MDLPEISNDCNEGKQVCRLNRSPTCILANLDPTGKASQGSQSSSSEISKCNKPLNSVTMSI